MFSSHSFWTSSSLDVPAGVAQEEGHTGGRSHRISHPPSFCGACLSFSREKDSAIPFPRRPRSRILCTTDLIVLHPSGVYFLFFYFFSEKNPVFWDRAHVPTYPKVPWLPLSYRGDRTRKKGGKRRKKKDKVWHHTPPTMIHSGQTTILGIIVECYMLV